MWKSALCAAIVVVAGCGKNPTLEKSMMNGIEEKIPGFDATTCAFNSNDPFEPKARIAKGPNAGQCVDTRKSRALVKLTPEQAKNYGGTADGVLSVANVSHKGRFYVAHIPVNAIKNAIFQLEYFPAVVPAGHTQLRLQFAPEMPVTLVSQSKDDTPSVERVQDLILSVEALGQPGFRYDIINGMKDHFAAVWRMTSLEEKYDHMVKKQNHRVEQWKLDMTSAEARKILESYVQKSNSLKYGEMYHTLKLNCTTEIIDAIDAGMNYNLFEKFGKFTAKTTDFYPNVIRISLQKRGLVPRFGKGNDLAELAKDTSIRFE